MENSAQKEIDILELLARFYRILKVNLIYTILFPLLGLVAGLLIYSTSTEKVTSEMLLATDMINITESTFWMEQLQNSGTLPGLPTDLQDISRIQYEIIPSGDPSTKKIFIKISGKVPKDRHLPELEKSIITFINQLEVVVNRRKQQEIYRRELISEIDAELKAMEDLKQGMTNASKASLMNPADLFVKSVELKDQKLKHQMMLEEQKSFEIIKHFSEVPSVESRHPAIYGLMGLLGGAIILFIVLAIKSFHQYYKRFEKRFEA